MNNSLSRGATRGARVVRDERVPARMLRARLFGSACALCAPVRCGALGPRADARPSLLPPDMDDVRFVFSLSYLGRFQSDSDDGECSEEPRTALHRLSHRWRGFDRASNLDGILTGSKTPVDAALGVGVVDARPGECVFDTHISVVSTPIRTNTIRSNVLEHMSCGCPAHVSDRLKSRHSSRPLSTRRATLHFCHGRLGWCVCVCVWERREAVAARGAHGVVRDDLFLSLLFVSSF